MGSFVSSDPRGYRVVFDEGAWRHADDHHGGATANFIQFAKVMTAPDFILDNEPIPGRTRIAQERYVRHEPSLGCYLIVPARILETGQVVVGHGRVEAGTRIAVSSYPSGNTPRGGVVWRKL